MRNIMKLGLLAAASMLAVSPVQADGLKEAISSDLTSLMKIYRDLHSNPELSGEEVRTAMKLAAEARRLGFTVTEKVGGTGVVAVHGLRAVAANATVKATGCIATVAGVATAFAPSEAAYSRFR